LIAVVSVSGGNAPQQGVQGASEIAAARVFGVWVRRQRRRKEMTVEQAARAARMNAHTWRALEAGMLSWETASVALPQIARGLDLAFEYVTAVFLCILEEV